MREAGKNRQAKADILKNFLLSFVRKRGEKEGDAYFHLLKTQRRKRRRSSRKQGTNERIK